MPNALWPDPIESGRWRFLTRTVSQAMLFWTGWILFAVLSLRVIPPMIALLVKQLEPQPNSDNAIFDDARSGERVSIIVPARNEGDNIGASLRSLLALKGVAIDLIAVNDRSSDNTGTVMDEVAHEDSRLRVIHIRELPDGWLGKNHAMHVAAGQASGTLLLFTDGDIVHEPQSLVTAVTHLRKNQLQHLCLFPRILLGGMFENATVAFFGLAFAVGMQLHLIRTRWPFSYAGVGAFNLVDTAFYRTVGGHVPIALDVLDDVKLGKLIKQHGGRQDFQSAPKLLSIRWYPSLWGVITGLEKNAFASLDYSVPKIIAVTIVFLAIMIFPYFAAALWPLSESGGWLATVLLWHASYAVSLTVSGAGWSLLPLFPVAACVMAFAYLRSAVITLRQQGIRWRDSFYPLDRLRQSIYR